MLKKCSEYKNHFHLIHEEAFNFSHKKCAYTLLCACIVVSSIYRLFTCVYQSLIFIKIYDSLHILSLRAISFLNRFFK